MKRVTQGGDINFDTTSVRGLGQTYTIKFYTINVNNYIMKTNTDVVNGIIALNWSELETLGGGVLNFMVDDNTADPEYSDGTYNRTFSGTTEYYIDMPLSEGGGGGDVDALTLRLNAEITRSIAKDNELSAAISNEATARENADSALSDRITANATAIANTYTKTEIDNMLDDIDIDLPENIVIDANYVHTDNNFTTAEKAKLAELDGKQYTILYLTKKSGNIYTFKDEDGNTLTYSDLKPILLEKDVTINFRNNIYYCFIISIDEDEGFYDAFFGFKSLNSNILNLEVELEEYDGEEPIFSVYESTENVHDTFYGICTTAATNGTKLAYPTGFVLREGNIVSIKFNNDVYTGATLNCNNTGAKAIRHRGSAIESMVIRGGDVATFMYYSGVYNLISVDRVNKVYTQAFSSQLNPNQNRVEYTLSQFGTYRLTYPTTTTGYDLYITLSDEGGNVVPEHTILFDGTELSGKGSVIFTNTLVWENNDDPTAQDDVFDHLGQTVNYVVVKIYETKYASYKAW